MDERSNEFEIIASILDLQPTSDPNEFKCLCPFHAETNPSFYINKELKVFHCFGCGEGGTLKRLLKLLKVEPEKIQIADRSVTEVLSRAQAFFRDQLRANYDLVSRSLGEKRIRFIDRFGLGYAPADKTELRKALSEFDDELLIKSGLFSQSLYPVLSNRITIPIRDKNGTIIGFAGRAIEPSMQPKYLNSRNLPRRLILFGVDEACNLLKLQPPGKQRIFVVEGYFDAMHLLYNQIPAVAICGTALTYPQATAIAGLAFGKARRIEDAAKIIVVLDADEAGMKASVNAALLLHSLNLDVRVLFLPDKDADEIEVHKFRSMQPVSIPTAVAQIIIRLRPAVREVAKILQQVPANVRRQVWALLHRRIRDVGAAYLDAIRNEFIRMPKPKPKPQTAMKFGLFELALSAAINSSFDLSQLSVDIYDVLPEHLKRIYEVVSGVSTLEQLNDKEQRIYAELAMHKPIVLPDALRIALEKQYWKSVIIKTLERSRTARIEEFPQLSEIFREAMKRFDELNKNAPDDVIDLSDMLQF